MIKIAILNKDGFYSKLLATKLNNYFPRKIKRITAFNSHEDVVTHITKILDYDLIAIGDGVCKDYPKLVKLLCSSAKCVANSKRFHRNKSMVDAGAHWIIPKDVVFDSYKASNMEVLAWKEAIAKWFFSPD